MTLTGTHTSGHFATRASLQRLRVRRTERAMRNCI